MPAFSPFNHVCRFLQSWSLGSQAPRPSSSPPSSPLVGWHRSRCGASLVSTSALCFCPQLLAPGLYNDTLSSLMKVIRLCGSPSRWTPAIAMFVQGLAVWWARCARGVDGCAELRYPAAIELPLHDRRGKLFTNCPSVDFVRVFWAMG